MENMKNRRLAAGILATAIVAVTALIYSRFRRDIRVAQERLQSSGSQVIDTACGQIEYATFGEGYPVLVLH